jgi:NADPH:quinone reductase-like Zn-dependent oxidoreductase
VTVCSITPLGGETAPILSLSTVPGHTIAKIPESVTYVDAAAIPCAGLTAFNSLYRRLHCKSGDLVLIHGGSGGVGGFAIQLAKQLGTTVVTTCSAANVDYVRDLGADEVIDHRTENVFERARQIAGPRLFDAIIDTIGARNGVDNLRLLAPEGGVAFIAGLPDLSRIDEVPYSVAIHDIGLGGVARCAAFPAPTRGSGQNGFGNGFARGTGQDPFDSFAGYIAGRDSTKPGHSG